ncbi:hypothetical protein [Thermus albus]|uniref:hypothetical protein n=1 Tax=Thermus albus TaxID=2908146 RepID=UPI001FAA7CE1|nr:hypothetical protein [Thermus albus]
MWPFQRKRTKPLPHPAEDPSRLAEAIKELEAQLAKAKEEIALLRSQNHRLAEEAAPALKENAVLRYELFKCQSDRQVLEFHLSGLRAELGGALALLGRLAPGEPPKASERWEEALLLAFLEVLEAARRLGARVEGLYEAEVLALRLLGRPFHFDPERFLLARLAGILAALEGRLSEALRKAERPGEALKAFPEPLEELRRRLAQAITEDAGGG